jgi:hypothetical protein
MPVSGCADRSALTLQPFLAANALAWQAESNAAAALPTDVAYAMPQPALFVATAAVPELLVAYLNSTTLKGPYENLQKESMDSRGKVRTVPQVMATLSV